MSELKGERTERSKDFVRRVVQKVIEESSFTRFWFLSMALVAFGFTLVIVVGCMSPATQVFALFSVNPHVLAHRYNAMVKNTTGAELYNEEFLSVDLRALPDIYRFGMSGVCREFTNQSEVFCTKQFMFPLDIDAIIKHDISNSTLPNTTASRLQTFWDSWDKNMTDNTQTNKSRRESLIHASASLTVTSLVIGPIGIAIAVSTYLLNLSSRKIIAISVALFDAGLVVAAAALWIVASVQYAAAFETTLGGQTIANTPYWNGTPQYPPSYGLLLIAVAALAKLCVLPILALIFLVGFPLMLILSALIIGWLMILLCQCISSCLDACPTTTTTTYYGSSYDNNWGS